MISAGQTVETAQTAQPVPVTNETFDLIRSYVCAADLPENDHTQCEQTLADAYIPSWQRVPEYFTALFESTVKGITGMLFSYCSESSPSDSAAQARCMFEAVGGKNVRFPMLGKFFSYTGYIVQLSYLYSGLMLTQCEQLPPADRGGFFDMRDGVEDGQNCTHVKECLPTADERRKCEEQSNFGEPDFSQTDYDACVINACGVRGRGVVSPWSDPQEPPHVPVPPASWCQPTFTEIQACAQEHASEGDEAIIDCAQRLCEERNTANTDEEAPEQDTTIPLGVSNPWGGSNPWQ